MLAGPIEELREKGNIFNSVLEGGRIVQCVSLVGANSKCGVRSERKCENHEWSVWLGLVWFGLVWLGLVLCSQCLLVTCSLFACVSSFVKRDLKWYTHDTNTVDINARTEWGQHDATRSHVYPGQAQRVLPLPFFKSWHDLRYFLSSLTSSILLLLHLLLLLLPSFSSFYPSLPFSSSFLSGTQNPRHLP